ncbi:hypothetical protein CW731_08640 [Polaribacter sp. ALD11]|uniref:hypothetical protein n=1 Tax=Polaribacter sp. ALD11 TaxID=2058137 RepID=UPI000C301FBF|nr:hypothetical protein [Polaribacter sp. ALD11]AUC85350.1 hypothetical protein CW731_08640 [Polaribacter sp. ALD11]
MRKIFLTLFCTAFFSISFAQNNSEIANVYINRANTVIEESIDFKQALVLFEKAMKYTDTITKPNVANLGAKIYFELKNYKEAQKYSKQYFLIAKNKNSEDYLQQLELFVTINEELELQLAEEKRLEQEKIKKAKELRRIDSLKIIWKNTSKEFSVQVDSIYQFNANNYALYRKNSKFGIINDKAEIIIGANEYASALSYAGYILLKNKEKEPTKVYYFNTNKGVGALLPNPSDFNSLSTNYGKILLPRSNGRLVTYPNNSYEPMVYDLNQNKIVKVSNKEEVLKDLKKNDIIRKYNKDLEVKIEKEWYVLGGHLGGGIHPLYIESDYKVYAFLCSIDGTLLFSSSSYDYIGAFHENKAQTIKGNTISWINQNGTKVSEAKDKMAKYAGNSKVIKLEEGVYQISKDGVIVKGNDMLEKMPDFLRKFQ